MREHVLQVCLIPYGLGKNTSKYDSCSEKWCDHVPQIPLGQFLVGVSCLCLLYSICNVPWVISSSLLSIMGSLGNIKYWATELYGICKLRCNYRRGLDRAVNGKYRMRLARDRQMIQRHCDSFFFCSWGQVQVIGPWPQGPVMGLQTMMNGIARIIGPAAVTVIYKHLGNDFLPLKREPEATSRLPFLSLLYCIFDAGWPGMQCA